MAEITNADEARTVMAASREQFSELILGMSSEEWNRTSNNGGWNNGQLCWHIAFGAGAGARTVARLRQNKGLDPPAPLMAIFNLLSLWLVRVRSRGATPESVLAYFDQGHGQTLKLVDGIRDDEWSNGATVLGEHVTVGGAFVSLQEHLDEHAAEMRRD